MTADDHRHVIPAHDGPASCTGCDWESRRIGIASTTQHEAHRADIASQTAADTEHHEKALCACGAAPDGYALPTDAAQWCTWDQWLREHIAASQTPATDSERVEQIRARVEAATPGPWWVQTHDSRNHPFLAAVHTTAEPMVTEVAMAYGVADGEFVAHAPEDVRYLLARLAEQAATIERVRAVHRPGEGYMSDDCVGCREDCAYCEGDHPYPCPTITALGSQRTEGQG